jgi:hypothetical protein
MNIIRDYWDKETVAQVVDIPKQYDNLFPQNFLEMKGIIISLRAMKIHLNIYVKPIKRRPYFLNTKYKEKVRKELDQMLDAGIIVPIEEEY